MVGYLPPARAVGGGGERVLGPFRDAALQDVRKATANATPGHFCWCIFNAEDPAELNSEEPPSVFLVSIFLLLGAIGRVPRASQRREERLWVFV